MRLPLAGWETLVATSVYFRIWQGGTRCMREGNAASQVTEEKGGKILVWDTSPRASGGVRNGSGSGGVISWKTRCWKEKYWGGDILTRLLRTGGGGETSNCWGGRGGEEEWSTKGWLRMQRQWLEEREENLQVCSYRVCEQREAWPRGGAEVPSYCCCWLLFVSSDLSSLH